MLAAVHSLPFACFAFLLVAAGGSVKASSSAASTTRMKTVAGTQFYMAPELHLMDKLPKNASGRRAYRASVLEAEGRDVIARYAKHHPDYTARVPRNGSGLDPRGPEAAALLAGIKARMGQGWSTECLDVLMRGAEQGYDGKAG